HNRVIENVEELKEKYQQQFQLQSETDTEVIVQLVEYFVLKVGYSPVKAFRKVLQELQGSYALAMIDQKEADKLYIAKNKSPLLVGVGVGFHVICSDALAMLDVTQEFVEILDGEMAEITRNTLELTRLDGEKIVRASRHL